MTEGARSIGGSNHAGVADEWLTPLLFASPTSGHPHSTSATRRRKTVVVGDVAVAAVFVQRVRETPMLALRLVDWPNPPDGPPDAQALINAVVRGRVGVVYVAVGDRPGQDMLDLLRRLQNAAIPLYLVSDRAQSEADPRWAPFLGLHLLCLGDEAPTRASFALKRLIDVAAASVLLVLTMPLLLIVAVAVKASSPGPIFFRQRRYGLRGEHIQVWKFRTMTVLEYGHVAQASRNDASVTPIGQFLRRTSLDELPQIFNILGGSMSFVGPRPHAVAHNEEYGRLIRGYLYRHSVKPGITGLAQINGFRGETSTIEHMEQRLRYDLEYMRHWSLLLDLKITARTVATLFFDRSAY